MWKWVRQSRRYRAIGCDDRLARRSMCTRAGLCTCAAAETIVGGTKSVCVCVCEGRRNNNKIKSRPDSAGDGVVWVCVTQSVIGKQDKRQEGETERGKNE